MKIFKLLCSVYLCFACMACVAPTTKQNTGLKLLSSNNNDASELLNYAEFYSNLPLEAQKQALVTTNQALAVNPTHVTQRMKLVMIYGLPSSGLFDGPKAQSLLQQCLQENILSNEQLTFGHLLFEYLIAINKANKSIKEEQKRIEAIAQKNETLQLKLDVSQQKLEATQQKLNDLKNIEKSMSEREITPRK